jgi:hypothetical protein
MERSTLVSTAARHKPRRIVGIPDAIATAIIESVATYRRPQGMEKGLFVLKDECVGTSLSSAVLC